MILDILSWDFKSILVLNGYFYNRVFLRGITFSPNELISRYPRSGDYYFIEKANGIKYSYASLDKHPDDD